VELRGADRDLALRDAVLEAEVLDEALRRVVVLVQPRIGRHVALAAGRKEDAPLGRDRHVPDGVVRDIVRQQVRDADLRDEAEERLGLRLQALERIVGMPRRSQVGRIGEINRNRMGAQGNRKRNRHCRGRDLTPRRRQLREEDFLCLALAIRCAEQCAGEVTCKADADLQEGPRLPRERRPHEPDAQPRRHADGKTEIDARGVRRLPEDAEDARDDDRHAEERHEKLVRLERAPDAGDIERDNGDERRDTQRAETRNQEKFLLARRLPEDAPVDVRRENRTRHVELGAQRRQGRREHRRDHHAEHAVRQKSRAHLDIAALVHLRRKVRQVDARGDRRQDGDDRKHEEDRCGEKSHLHGVALVQDGRQPLDERLVSVIGDEDDEIIGRKEVKRSAMPSEEREMIR